MSILTQIRLTQIRLTQIRKIEANELDVVRDLAMHIWTRHHRTTIAPLDMDQTVSALFDLEQMEDDMRDHGYAHFVARVGRVDVGFATAHQDGGRIWIPHLYVMRDFRGFGLGKALIRAAQDHFTPARDLVIHVHKGDDASVDFCQRSGFRVMREIDRSIGGYDVTDYLMHKYLVPCYAPIPVVKDLAISA